MDNPELAAHYQFDEADLFANRNGRLSDKQRDRLLTMSKRATVPMLGCGLVFFGIASIFPIAFAPMMVDLRNQIGPLIGLIVGVLVWAVVWGAVGVFIIRWAFSKPSLTLDHAEGPVNIVGIQRYNQSSHNYYTAHELHVGGHTFNVEGSLADTVVQGDPYAIYFLKKSGTIMSMEQLRPAH